MTKTEPTDARHEFASPKSSIPRLLEAEVRFDQLVSESKRQAMRLVEEATEAARKRAEGVEAELQEAVEALHAEMERRGLLVDVTPTEQAAPENAAGG